MMVNIDSSTLISIHDFSSIVVEVSLESSVYEVSEGMSVAVCVSLSNEIERDVEVTLNTSSSPSTNFASGVRIFQMLNKTTKYKLTAETDYNPVNQVLTFQSSGQLCEDVMTSSDVVLEDREILQISLSTSDPDVVLGSISQATITILDDNSRCRIHTNQV